MGRFWEEGMWFLVTVRPGGWGQFKSSSLSHFCHSGRFLLTFTQRETQRKFKRERETQTLDWPIWSKRLFLSVPGVFGRVIKRMDLRQKDKEKAKEKEKEVAPGDRTPKVRGVAKSNRTRPRMMAVWVWPVWIDWPLLTLTSSTLFSSYILYYGLFYDITGKDLSILRPWPDQIPMKAPCSCVGCSWPRSLWSEPVLLNLIMGIFFFWIVMIYHEFYLVFGSLFKGVRFDIFDDCSWLDWIRPCNVNWFLFCNLTLWLCVCLCWIQDQKWTVVREKHHEDRGHGKMCGDWVDSENCVIIVAYCATCELMRF